MFFIRSWNNFTRIGGNAARQVEPALRNTQKSPVPMWLWDRAGGPARQWVCLFHFCCSQFSVPFLISAIHKATSKQVKNWKKSLRFLKASMSHRVARQSIPQPLGLVALSLSPCKGDTLLRGQPAARCPLWCVTSRRATDRRGSILLSLAKPLETKMRLTYFSAVVFLVLSFERGLLHKNDQDTHVGISVV